MLKSRLAISVSFVACLVLSGCGGNSSNTVPQAQDPNAPTTSTPAPATTPTPTPGLPDLTSSAPIALPRDASGNLIYQGLEDLKGVFSPPLVGDPQLKLTLTVDPTGALNGTMLFFFEDNAGAWWMQQKSFDGTGFRDSSVMDIIFQDDVVVTRISAQRSGTANDTLTGTFYYRIRSAGDDQVCTPVTYTCTAYGTPPPGYTNGCPTPPDTVTPCEQYMAVSNSQVKVVGTFTGSLSAWVTPASQSSSTSSTNN